MVHAEATAPVGGVTAPPSPEVVRAQLARIQASPDFDVPGRAHKFLGYVVEETLAGRAERIKAYSIALEVFGRDSSFDAQADPVVRIEAGRVRRALERYYLTAGKSDAILITIPKGGYVPQFEERASTEEPLPPIAPDLPASAAWWQLLSRWHDSMSVAVVAVLGRGRSARLDFPQPAGALARTLPTSISQPDIPRLLIEPFEDLTGTESSAILARGLTEEIIGQIAKFKDLQVIEAPSASAKAVAGVKPSAPARYALLGSVRIADDTLRLTARLRKLDDGSILWAQSYDEDLAVQGVLAVQADIAREVTTALAQPYGVIFQADSARVTQSPPNDWDAYSCTLAYYTYRHSMDWDDHSKVQGCLERTVELYPTYATAWALLSIIYLDDFRFRFPKTVPVPTRPCLGSREASVGTRPAECTRPASADDGALFQPGSHGRIESRRRGSRVQSERHGAPGRVWGSARSVRRLGKGPLLHNRSTRPEPNSADLL